MTEPMNPVLAAQLALKQINPELLTVAERHPRGDGSRHMAWMFLEIAKGEMSVGKANRWLGWAQCLAMIYYHLDLETCKQINKKAGA